MIYCISTAEALQNLQLKFCREGAKRTGTFCHVLASLLRWGIKLEKSPHIRPDMHLFTEVCTRPDFSPYVQDSQKLDSGAQTQIAECSKQVSSSGNDLGHLLHWAW